MVTERLNRNNWLALVRHGPTAMLNTCNHPVVEVGIDRCIGRTIPNASVVLSEVAYLCTRGNSSGTARSAAPVIDGSGAIVSGQVQGV